MPFCLMLGSVIWMKNFYINHINLSLAPIIRQFWINTEQSRLILNHCSQLWLIWFQKHPIFVLFNFFIANSVMEHMTYFSVLKKVNKTQLKFQQRFINGVKSLFSYSFWILNHLLLLTFTIFNLMQTVGNQILFQIFRLFKSILVQP